VRGHNPTAARRACMALTDLVAQSWWTDVFTAYSRCARITRGLDEQLSLNPQVYEESVEHQLHDAYLDAAMQLESTEEPAEALGDKLRALAPTINAYFEGVLVNAEDNKLRSARLALVQHIAGLTADVADLSKLQGF